MGNELRDSICHDVVVSSLVKWPELGIELLAGVLADKSPLEAEMKRRKYDHSAGT